MSPRPLPRWADVGLIPLINVFAALVVSGIVVAIIGENPFEAMMVMIKGAFVYKGSLGYTLYYATNFIFTGLAVAVAFHAMLFNIGGEGQAYLGGLGAGLTCLLLDSMLRRSCLCRWRSWRRPVSARSGAPSRATFRQSAAAISSSPPSCSISSPRRSWCGFLPDG